MCTWGVCVCAVTSVRVECVKAYVVRVYNVCCLWCVHVKHVFIIFSEACEYVSCSYSPPTVQCVCVCLQCPVSTVAFEGAEKLHGIC